jgi:hypothetical protein
MKMTQTDAFRAILGVMVLTSAALSAWVSPWWLLMTTFIGLNLFQSAFTRFCGLSLLLEKTKLPKQDPSPTTSH